ncbi:MAG: mercury transporter [Alphaproteobacteria bacterium HGW-Alphaproteobacteria-6]|nr:MAG: mercury transporter [Alphaproteobacteria bacterium HGW-Alphaproteobacteria-6]
MHSPDAIANRDDAAAPRRRARVWQWLATLGSIFGAGTLTACCLLPLALVSAGVTGSFIARLTALSAYKWITIPISLGFLGWGFWQVYRPARCADGSCAVPLVSRRAMTVTLWLAAAVMAVAVLFPSLYDPFAGL